MPTMSYPRSTAINSNGGCFYHGGRQHLDLSGVKFGSHSGLNRARYEIAEADILVDATECKARPQKRKLWFAPGGTGHEEDEHQPGGARRKRQAGRRPDQVEQIQEVIEERPTKRARIPSRKAREANGAPRETSPAINSGPYLMSGALQTSPATNTGLYLMSGALQSSPAASPGPSTAVHETVEEIPTPAAPGPFTTALGTTIEDSTPTAPGPTNSENPTTNAATGNIPRAQSEQVADRTVTTKRAPKAKPITKTKPTASSSSNLPPAPGMVRNARGKWVDAKASARMENAWKGRVQKGTSGRHGGPPMKKTVTKNTKKGVDYGDASDVYQA